MIDLGTNTVTDNIEVGGMPFNLALSSDGSTLYTANQWTNDISVIDTATKTVTATWLTGETPTGIAIDSADTTLYVTHAVGYGYMSIIAL